MAKAFQKLYNTFVDISHLKHFVAKGRVKFQIIENSLIRNNLISRYIVSYNGHELYRIIADSNKGQRHVVLQP